MAKKKKPENNNAKHQENKNKHPGGRPTDYTFEFANEICNAIATSSQGLKKLCRLNEHWPHPDTIYMWLMKHKEFADLYAQAKRNQIEVLVDELVEIADDTTHDETYDHRGEVVPNNEFINRSRVRIDTRKWLASKLIPRVYGDKVEQTVNTKIDANVEAEIININDIDTIKSRLADKLRKKAESTTD